MERPTKFPYQFFTVTFLWSWLIWLPLLLNGLGMISVDKGFINIMKMPLSYLGAFGPAVGAFYCLKMLHGKDAIRQYLKSLLDLRFGWKAWLVPILALGGTTWFAWILPELWGVPRLPMLLPSIWVFPPFILIMILFGGGQEELGWRGYILDPLEERLGPWLGNLVLGIVWAVWHLPLFFIPGTSQVFMPFVGFMILMIGYSWFFAWVRQSSGKRTMAGLVAHGLSNAFVPLFPTVVMVEGVAQPRFWIWVSLTLALGFFTMLIRWSKIKQVDISTQVS